MRILFILLLFPIISLAQRRDTVRVSGQGGSGSGSGDVTLPQLQDSLDAVRADFPVNDSIAKIGAQRTVVHVDANNYVQGPITFQTPDGWTYLASNESAMHIHTGVTKLRRTKDGSNWSEPWVPTVAGFDTVGVAAWGNNGQRIFVKFMRVLNGLPIYTKTFYAHADVVGNEIPVVFTLTDSTGLPPAQVEKFPYGQIAPVVNGHDTIYSTGYTNWDQDTASAYIERSFDNGETWEFYKYIIRGRNADVFPTGKSVNETDWLVVNNPTSVATAKIIFVVRDQGYLNYHKYLYSDDGANEIYNVAVEEGKWWTEDNVNNSAGEDDRGDNPYPVDLFLNKAKGQIVAVYGHRGINGANGGEHQIRVKRVAIANDAYKNPDNWSKPTKPYAALAPIKLFPNDFGYTTGYEINGQEFSASYDASNYAAAGAVAAAKTRIFTMPLEGNNHLYVHAKANQAIPTGVETRVLTRYVKYDSERYYNEDSSKVYFTVEGVYNIDAYLRLDTTSFGTKVTVSLYMIDRGDELSASPSIMVGKHIIDRKTIEVSTDSAFMRVSLHGQIYAYNGMELRLTVTHDKGSDLNVINTVMDDRATIKFNKSY